MLGFFLSQTYAYLPCLKNSFACILVRFPAPLRIYFCEYIPHLNCRITLALDILPFPMICNKFYLYSRVS